MMMKQQASEASPKMFVAAFTFAVTTEGRHCKDWIARKGQYSLQSTLERMIPEIILSDNEKKFRIMSKIAAAAFLKVVEGKCGFRRIRIRRQGLDSEAGDLVYCNRRWLNPSLPADRALLERNHEALCLAFPTFARCSLDTFLEVLEDVASSWGAVLSKIRSRAPDAKFCSPYASLPQGSFAAPPRVPNAFGGIAPTSSRRPSRPPSSAMDLGNLLNPDGLHSAAQHADHDALPPIRSPSTSPPYAHSLLPGELARSQARDCPAAALPSFPRFPEPAAAAAPFSCGLHLAHDHATSACGAFGFQCAPPRYQMGYFEAVRIMAAATSAGWPWS